MSLEDAIMRRVRLGQSFCSYSFKTMKKVKGKTFIEAERNHQYLSNSHTTKFIETAETICLSASRLKSTARQSSRNPAQTEIEAKLKTKTPSIQQSVPQKLSLHSLHSITKQKPNKMEEYLSDFYELRSDFEFKSNKYENIPKLPCKNSQNLPYSQTKPDNNRHPYLNNYIQTQSCQIVRKQFDCEKMLELFYDFSLDENCVELPYNLFRLVNLHNNIYVETSISQKLFSEIPIKQYCHKLNNFSINLEENIFYLALSKSKLQDQFLPYTECFFWISKPIKHTERTPTLKNILKFYTKCLKRINPNSICHKIWIVDYNGRISFLNKQPGQSKIHKILTGFQKLTDQLGLLEYVLGQYQTRSFSEYYESQGDEIYNMLILL